MAQDNNKIVEERRSHRRFKIKKCTIAVSAKLGQVVDISMGGLSFSYIETNNWLKESMTLATLFGPDDLCLDDFPMRIISDCSLGNGVSMLRRCGVQFGELDQKQITQLEHFIWVNSMLENSKTNFSE